MDEKLKSRRSFLKAVGITGLSLAIPFTRCKNSASKRRPNILFLFSDDQRWDALGCAGNPVIQTPNQDRLAAEGIMFENSFVTTSICCVSRASVLSGQYARRHGINDFEKMFSDAAMAQTYPAILRDHGYYTGFIGKWGIGANYLEKVDKASEFFDFWGGDSFQANYWHDKDCPYVTNNGVDHKTDNKCTCSPKGSYPRTGHKGMAHPLHTTTQVVPHKVEQFLQSADRNKPFCLSISFKASHAPWQDYPESLATMYKDEAMPIPDTATPEEAAKLPAFLRKSLESDRGAKLVRDHDMLSEMMRQYYRLITALDISIGKIRELLSQYGVAENTVIIFSSDNGHYLGEHGLFGKWLAHEPSIRVPTIIYDPRLPAEIRGQRRQQMILNIDFAPTMLEMAGVAIPDKMQGKSLTPLLRGNPDRWRDDWYYEHDYIHGGAIVPCQGVRTNRWKYIRYYNQQPIHEELYDLQTDSEERNNLVNEKKYQNKLAEMRKKWSDFRKGLK